MTYYEDRHREKTQELSQPNCLDFLSQIPNNNLVADKQQIHSFGWFVTTKIVLFLGLIVAPGLHETDFITFFKSVLFSNSNFRPLSSNKVPLSLELKNELVWPAL